MITLSLRRRAAIGVAAVALAATGCGGDAPEALALVDDTPPIDAPAEAGFTDEQLHIIDFHVDWLCELDRRTFTELGDADAALTEALATNNISEEAYDLFIGDTLQTQSGRDAVRYGYQETCRAQ